MRDLKVDQGTNPARAGAREVRIRCPGCKDRVTLEAPGDAAADLQFVLAGQVGQVNTGQRRCPNPRCGAHIFVVLDPAKPVGDDLLCVYPAERIDFDATDLPETVVTALEEAIACHSEACYVAAAIMVRKTLEEVCRDQGASGGSLKERLAALGKNVVMPQPMLEALDDLRLLGNDAAHVESRVYDEIGEREVEVALDVTKEILKATYQYQAIMGRLREFRQGGAK